MKYVILGISVLTVLLLIIYAYYNGFRKIEIVLKYYQGDTVVCKPLKGNYNQSGKISDEVYWELIDKFNITTYKGIGLYYDNPKEIPINELRSDIGCIIEKSDISKLNALVSAYTIKKIPEKNYPTVEFPYKGKLSMIIGLLKVYPALNKYKNDNEEYKRSYIIETWDIPNNRIIYRID